MEYAIRGDDDVDRRLVLAFWLLLTSVAHAQLGGQFCDPSIVPTFTTTARAGLQVPVCNACNWCTPANFTLNRIATEACFNDVSCNLLARGLTFAALTAYAPSNGTLQYCTDCMSSMPCTGGGTGAIASRVNNAWNCSIGGSGHIIQKSGISLPQRDNLNFLGSAVISTDIPGIDTTQLSIDSLNPSFLQSSSAALSCVGAGEIAIGTNTAQICDTGSAQHWLALGDINGNPILPPTDTPLTCATALNGAQYFDTSLAKDCLCDSTIPAWCSVDTRVCGTSTSCGTTDTTSAQPVINVRAAPFRATGNGSTDDTAAILAAAATMPAAGGHLHFPAGTYLVSDTGAKGCALAILQQQSLFTGDGAGATALETLTTGSGYDILCNVAPKTCTGGTGSCDSAIGSSGRGAGCICYVNTDCQSGTCAGGTAKRYGTIRDMRFILRTPNSTAVDLGGLSGWLVQNTFFSLGGGGNPGALNVLFADAAGLGGYDNTLSHSTLQSAATCVRYYSTANDNRILDSAITNCNGSGVVISGGNAAIIKDTLFQSNNGGAGTAYDIDNSGVATRIISDRFEDSLVTAHIRNQAGATLAEIHDNYHTGTALSLVDSSSSRPEINIAIQGGGGVGTKTSEEYLLFRRPPWTRRGLLNLLGLNSWRWTARGGGTATIDAIGMDAPVVNGTAAASSNGRGHSVNFQSGAVSGNVGGLTPFGGTYNAFQFQERPNFVFSGEASDSASVRYWIGLFSADPTASSTPAVTYLAFRYDDSIDGTTWRACQDNGSGTPTCTDTAVTFNTAVRFNAVIQTGTVDNAGTTSPAYFIEGLRVATMTGTIPVSSTTLHAVATVTTRTTAAKNIKVGVIAATTPNVGT